MNSGLPSVLAWINRASRFGSAWRGNVGQVLPDRILGEVLERKFVAEPVRLQLALDAFERMVAKDHVHRPVGPDHHQSRRVAPAREIGEQIERRIVAPVQVLEHAGSRGVSAVSDSSASTISRSMRSRVAPATADGARTRRRRDERGKLEQPGGRVLAQHLERRSPPRLAAQPRALRAPAERLACAVLLQALAARDPDAASPPPSQERLTSVVLPMPASPVTNTTCRSPGEGPVQPAAHPCQLRVTAEESDSRRTGPPSPPSRGSSSES